MPRLPILMSRLSRRLRTLLRIWRERRELAALDPRQMRDMGITEDVRRRELRRPFWTTR